jgi:hypothetical protein
MKQMTGKPLFEVGKTYKTRDGRSVIIYSVNAPSDYPIHGAIQCGDGTWFVESWTPSGKWKILLDCEKDLMPPNQPETEVRIHVRIVKNGHEQGKDIPLKGKALNDPHEFLAAIRKAVEQAF